MTEGKRLCLPRLCAPTQIGVLSPSPGRPSLRDAHWICVAYLTLRCVSYMEVCVCMEVCILHGGVCVYGGVYLTWRCVCIWAPLPERCTLDMYTAVAYLTGRGRVYIVTPPCEIHTG